MAAARSALSTAEIALLLPHEGQEKPLRVLMTQGKESRCGMLYSSADPPASMPAATNPG